MADQRRVLVCPQCGAPLPPSSAHETVTCAFCGTTSAIASLVAEAMRSNLVCPRCEQRLFAGDAEGVAMLGCGVCGGIWLDNEAAQRVTQHFNARAIEMATRASESAQRRPDVRAVVKCAACGTEMGRRTFGQVSVDVCQAHGTWFDAGELATLLAPTRPMPAPPTQMAPATYDQPATNWDTQAGGAVLNTAGSVAAEVAGQVAVGAFEILIGILTD